MDGFEAPCVSANQTKILCKNSKYSSKLLIHALVRAEIFFFFFFKEIGLQDEKDGSMG